MGDESRRNTDLLRRLRSVEGHVRGIQRLVDSDAPCLDVVRQIVAVQRALEKVNGLVLDRHLNCCVSEDTWAKDAEARKRALDEVLRLIEAIR